MKYLKKKRKILFLAAVHGDEGFTIKLLKKLEKEFPGKFDWMLGNKKALKLGKRFVEADLNRVAPGSVKSNIYEERRAAQIIAKANNYKAVIDLHGTDAKTGIFVIVTNPKIENLKLAETLPVRNVVLWESEIKSPSGPITRFVNRGLEIECGPKNSKKVSEALYQMLRSIVSKNPSRTINKKRYFRVYGKIYRDNLGELGSKTLIDFKKTTINRESFYPLIVGQYRNILCYKMESKKNYDH